MCGSHTWLAATVLESICQKADWDEILWEGKEKGMLVSFTPKKESANVFCIESGSRYLGFKGHMEPVATIQLC